MSLNDLTTEPAIYAKLVQLVSFLNPEDRTTTGDYTSSVRIGVIASIQLMTTKLLVIENRKGNGESIADRVIIASLTEDLAEMSRT